MSHAVKDSETAREELWGSEWLDQARRVDKAFQRKEQLNCPLKERNKGQGKANEMKETAWRKARKCALNKLVTEWQDPQDTGVCVHAGPMESWRRT